MSCNSLIAQGRNYPHQQVVQTPATISCPLFSFLALPIKLFLAGPPIDQKWPVSEPGGLGGSIQRKCRRSFLDQVRRSFRSRAFITRIEPQIRNSPAGTLNAPTPNLRSVMLTHSFRLWLSLTLRFPKIFHAGHSGAIARNISAPYLPCHGVNDQSATVWSRPSRHLIPADLTR